MADPAFPDDIGDAEAFYQKGLGLKQLGDYDVALTEFRRAVLADPGHAKAHFEVGLLCRKKAETDGMFQRYAFESFQKAARLDPENREAHDQYVLAAQRLHRLDEVHVEYDQLAKAQPDNPLFERCLKNIVTISMAMIPEKVSIVGGAHSRAIRKLFLFLAIGAMALGFIFIFGPLILGRGANPLIPPDQVRNLVRLGAVLEAAALAAFLGRSFLDR